ncbi:MAG: immune inhibitor A domain-containing protein, partial [Candidatus Eiseniibacteriota bacterium]
GAEETDQLDQVWSHKFNLPGGVPVDGKTAFLYTTEPEAWGLRNAYESAGDIISRGVFCHEFGHILGLPDLYDLTDGTASSEGVGEWELMGTGVYNHLPTRPLGSSPAHMSAWSKIRLGWVTPTWVLQDSAAVTIPPVETSGQVFRLWTNGDDAGEYFLVENRQPVGSDSALVRSSNETTGGGPSHGLIIWHVDDSIGDNNNATHKLLDVEEAGGPEFLLGRNGAQNLDVHRGAVASQQACGTTISVTGNRGDKYDPWPGARNATSFDGSCPASGSYCNGNPSQVAVRNIVETGTDVTADFYVTGVTVRRLALAVDDQPFNGHPNNGNGFAEPGETVRLRLPLHNYGPAPTGPLVATLSTGSLLTLSPNSITYASIAAGGTDSGSVVEATVLPASDPLGVPITMHLEAAAGIVDADSVQVLVGVKTGLCDDFESTMRNWGSTAEGCDGVNEWHREAGIDHTPTGTWAWRLGPMGTIGSFSPSQDSRLVSQPVRLTGAGDTLTFWQRYDCLFPDDGLSVEISTDGAETWTRLNPAPPGYSNGDHWSGTQTTFGLVPVKVPLDGYSGIVQISFRFQSSPPASGLGWWIDDVAVTGTDECATTAIQVARFDAIPVAGRAAVLLSWKLADAVGGTVGIDRASSTRPRERIVTLPWEDRVGQYEDAGVSAGLGYQYWITAARPGDPDATAGPIAVAVPAGVGGGSPPRVLAMSRVRPNPFSPNATFSVSLDRDGPYVVRVYRADGSLVRTLADSPGYAG